jgi:hypothetical protein
LFKLLSFGAQGSDLEFEFRGLGGKLIMFTILLGKATLLFAIEGNISSLYFLLALYLFKP